MKLKRITAFLIALLNILLLSNNAFAASSSSIPETASQTNVVMDVATGQVLVEKGMNQKMYPASITKIMTAILALENADPSQMHTMSYEATHSIDANSTHIALTEGEEISLNDLLYAMMVASANDAANGVAECVGGTIDHFVQMMNDKAKEIGAVNTHFVNANGLHDDDHYTTAYDMALITRYALGVEGFRKYWCAEEYTIKPTNKQSKERHFGTEHSMFVTSNFTYEGCTGGKLGYTDEARHTSATSAKRGDLELVCITMSSQKYEKFEDTAALFDYCFASFVPVTLSKRELQGFAIPVIDKETQVNEVRIYPDTGVTVQLHRHFSAEDLKLSYNVPDKYLSGQEIAPTLSVRLTAKDAGKYMYPDLGSFALSYTIEDIGASGSSQQGEIPVKDETAFFKKLLSVLKWVGIAAGILVALFALIIAVGLVRRAVIRRRRRLKKSRQDSASEHTTQGKETKADKRDPEHTKQ